MARIRLLFILNGIAIAAFGPFASVILAEPRLRDRADRPADRDDLGRRGPVDHRSGATSGTSSSAARGRCGSRSSGRPPCSRCSCCRSRSRWSRACTSATRPSTARSGRCRTPLAVNALRDPGRQYGKVRAFASASFTVAAVIFGLLYGRVGYWPSGVLFVVVAVAIAVNAGGLPDLGRATLSSSRRGGAVREVLSIQPALPRVLVAVGPGARRRVRRVHVPLAAHRRARAAARPRSRCRRRSRPRPRWAR